MLLAYSARNRSTCAHPATTTAIRRPSASSPLPDPLANPYLGFAAMLMAGLDGIRTSSTPARRWTKDLYDVPPKELKKIPTVCGSLREALMSLDKGRGFLRTAACSTMI